MARTYISQSNTLSLEEVLARLRRREVVDGLVVMGSGGEGVLTPSNDYDLLVVLREMPVPISVALTYVDERLTDIIFTTAATIDRLVQPEEQIGEHGFDTSIVHWLHSGQVAFDRTGRIKQLQRKVRSGDWLKPPSDAELYPTWFGVNYNVLQTRRMLASDDPVYGTAVDVRLLYTLAEVWFAYFRMRRLQWTGEKNATRYLMQHDPDYLALFRECLAETNRERRFELYRQLAALSLAPLGGLWPEGSTAIQVEAGADAQLETIERGLHFWESLVAGED